MTGALQEVHPIHQATTEAAARHQAGQATALAAAEATAGAPQAEDIVVAEQAEAAVHQVEEDKDLYKTT